MKKISIGLGALLAAALLSFAVLGTTRAGQVLYGPGSPVVLTGATPAAPGATNAGGVIVDTVVTQTNGYLADVRNNGTSKYAVDFNGKVISPCATVKAAGAATCGTAALDSSGTVTISTTAVTANSLIAVSRVANGGTAGTEYVALTADITAGTSFIVRSYSSGTTAATTDTSTIYWNIVN